MVIHNNYLYKFRVNSGYDFYLTNLKIEDMSDRVRFYIFGESIPELCNLSDIASIYSPVKIVIKSLTIEAYTELNTLLLNKGN